jgi:hypothetical protein
MNEMALFFVSRGGRNELRREYELELKEQKGRG